MDFPESTKIVYERICKIEPEYVSNKIIGYLMLNSNGEQDMIRLAFSPDSVIQCMINKAKSDLGIGDSMAGPVPISALADPHLQFSSYPPRLVSSPIPQPYSEDFPLHNRIQFLTLEDQLEPMNQNQNPNPSPVGLPNCFYPEPAALGVVRTSRRSPSLPDFPVKVCHYFSKGYCRHGNNCRFFHGQLQPENEQPFGIGIGMEDHVVNSVGPLEKLEMEIVELLRLRRGIPISIASLPMIYYEKYGRNLQADGYLTESQRHGKAGYSLTKLLARLNCIRLIDRPHGQHSIILAEDAPNYVEFSSDRCETGSRQIYLTFPAESTFTEQDVSNYFNKYGPVQDVRIPCQQKRMFGFVTFVYVETVKQILAKTNPHFVCGAQVLVKPYKEKFRLFERKNNHNVEKSPLPMYYYIQNLMEGDLEQQCVPRVCDGSRLKIRKHFMEESEQQDILLTSKTSSQIPYLGLSTKNSTETKDLSSTQQLNDFLDSLIDHSALKSTAHDSPYSTQGLNLPDSPFASPIRSGISTAI